MASSMCPFEVVPLVIAANGGVEWDKPPLLGAKHVLEVVPVDPDWLPEQ
jgi:hypothetical protein